MEYYLSQVQRNHADLIFNASVSSIRKSLFARCAHSLTIRKGFSTTTMLSTQAKQKAPAASQHAL
jgi:hypothetical protein